MAPDRHANVPADAFREDDQWAHGEKVDDKKRGEWSYWRDSGELVCREDWGDDGNVLVRRYDHGELVFEGIWSADPSVPPEKVEYYDGKGAVIVRYRSNGDGTGTWTLFDDAGGVELELPEPDERERSAYGNWARFLPGFARYELRREKRNPEVIRENFHEAHTEKVLAAAIEALKPSKSLTAALGTGWNKVATAFGHGKELPPLVQALLADDNALAEYALPRIWMEIEHQGTLYESTFRIATAIATVLPEHADRPDVERRLLSFLRDILNLPHITVDGAAHKRLLAAMQPSVPRLQRWAEEAHAPDLLQLLGRIGGGSELAARWMREDDRAENRAFAACVFALGSKPAARATALTARLASEEDPFVLLVIAILLAHHDQVRTPETLEILEAALASPSQFDAAFTRLEPLLGNDVRVAVLACLPADAIVRNADVVLAALADDGGLLYRIAYLDRLLGAVFAGQTPAHLSDVQRKTLRATARMLDAHTNFVNLLEVVRAHGIPTESFAARKWADGRSVPVAKKKTKPAPKKKTKPAPKKKTAAKKKR